MSIHPTNDVHPTHRPTDNQTGPSQRGPAYLLERYDDPERATTAAALHARGLTVSTVVRIIETDDHPRQPVRDGRLPARRDRGDEPDRRVRSDDSNDSDNSDDSRQSTLDAWAKANGGAGQ